VADDAPRLRPRPGPALRWVIGIVVVQGAALLVGSLAYGAWAAVTRPDHTGLAVTAAVVVLLAALVLLGTARGLARYARASVSPMLIVELLMLPIGWSMAQAGQWALSAALVVPAVAVIGLLFTAEGREVMRGGPGED
jgi:hypothetical protein